MPKMLFGALVKTEVEIVDLNFLEAPLELLKKGTVVLWVLNVAVHRVCSLQIFELCSFGRSTWTPLGKIDAKSVDFTLVDLPYKVCRETMKDHLDHDKVLELLL